MPHGSATMNRMETRLDASRDRFVRQTARRFFVRFHMALMFLGAMSAGVLASRWLFISGVDALAERYALAVVGAYVVFLVLVRTWIFYVTLLAPDDPAPVILPEAAFEALLAAGLVKAARRAEFGGWARGVLRSTALPFALVLAAAVVLGWAVQHVCPAATRLLDVLTRCP